jgi:hypothetical protein
VAAQEAKMTAPVMCPHDDRLGAHLRHQSEAKCLRQLKGLASRSGDQLRLTMLAGPPKLFRDNSKACNNDDAAHCIMHTLTGYYPMQQAFVVRRGFYEGRFIDYVSRRSGKVIQLDDDPQFSPAGKRFVAVGSHEMQDTVHDIAVYSALTDPPTLEWSYKAPNDEFLEFAGWDGEDRIKLRISRSIARQFKTLDADLVSTRAGWQLHKPTFD